MEERIVNEFKDYLLYERNYSKNTATSYLNDIAGLKDF